jgi:CHAT domain-containing protein
MRRRWRRIALPLGAVALTLAGPERTAVLLPPPARGTDTHTYSYFLKPGWLLHLSLEQQHLDVIARVLDPGGRELFQVDSPSGDTGSEEVWLVASSAGVHRVVVKPWKPGPGRYEARVRALRPATDEDRVNARAELDYQLAFQEEGGDARRSGLEERYLRAARAWKSLGRSEREADARFRLGGVRARRRDWRGVLEAQSRARDLFHLAGARQAEFLALDRIAEAQQALGELAEARRTLQGMVLRWRLLGDAWNAVATSHRLCQLVHLGGRAWDALECYERVVSDWHELGRSQEEGMARVDVGALYVHLGDLDRGLESLRAALELLPPGSSLRGSALNQIGVAYLRAGLPKRALCRFREALAAGAEASALSGMGLAWQRLGRPDRALPLFERSLALLDTPAGKATVWGHIGRLHLSQGRPRPAESAFKRALSESGRDRASRAGALSGLARAARLQGNWDTARRRMEAALDLIERLRADVGDAASAPGQGFLVDLLKATYLASKQDDYAFLVDLLMERGYEREALDVNERALGRSLSDSLAPAPPWSTLLDADTVLLEYALGEERSWLWWVTDGELASFELSGRAVLETAARELHDLASRRRANLARLRRQSAKAAALLLGPVMPRLRQQRLVIVAPDVLQYMPFETLLLDQHVVSRVPSATVLARLRNRSAGREPAQGLALLGGGVFSPLDERLPAGTRAEESGPRRLPWVNREVRSVLEKAGNRTVLAAVGFAAVPEVALGGGLRSFSFLHLNGHGRSDPKRPEEAGVLLSSYAPRGLPRPGWLTAEQIRGLHLRADLVVLSACRTGLGREVRGEGLVGLSQSFLAAGATSVVASLWNVDDRATAALMDRFYDELLRHGRSPADALRRAQLSLRSQRRWSSPYYWGGFVLQGDGLNNARTGGSP